ncbi:MAG: 16S rRNA (adenine(1518)-N(6)/adenine(1519)-N(6))-dimethyltransferase RsmA [Candidatus Omnitrophica bacterium]|nr:16S rRNA (adenine(1518)-N(6)/adenine(1519)-N(6))-dimethyltransferase RsmA [Candidatus Omnitrophota bacterium]
MRIKPKKSLGQNFLTDKNIQRKIIAAYCLETSDRVLEIGAGYGEITKLIAGNAGFVYAVEIDSQLCKVLRENTNGLSNVEIINEDIMKLDFNASFKGVKNKIKVVGNIPYYITTPIIEYLFKHRQKIKTVFLMVQKEFAKRIAAVAGSKEYGSFSCFVNYYSIPKILFVVKKNSFTPAPKVDSCLLELKIRESAPVKVKDEELFFKVIRAGFNKRRKTLRNSLEGIISPDKLREFFRENNIDSNVRPERLNLIDFARLADKA